MQLQITTDYAIRIVSYLYDKRGELFHAKVMSDELGITYKYFMKVIKQLIDAGIVQSIQGCNGGYCLTPKAESLTLYDIIIAMQGGIYINRCLEEDKFCSINAADNCPFHKVFSSVQDSLIDIFKSKRIGDYV